MEECRVSWLLFVLCFFGFHFERIIKYLWISHKILVANFWGRGLKKRSIGCVWFWLYLFYNHCSLVNGMVKMYAQIWL